MMAGSSESKQTKLKKDELTQEEYDLGFLEKSLWLN